MALAARQTDSADAADKGQKTENSAAVRDSSSVLPSSPSFLNDPNLVSATRGQLGQGELFLRMMLAVGVVIVLGGVALYVSKRALPRVVHAGGKEIHLVETTYLGPRKALHLVEVGGQRLLLASTQDRVTMLAPIEEDWLDRPKAQLGEEAKA